MPLPEPGDGQALVRNEFLSVDPYMRGRMREAKSYVPPFEVGKVMEGGAVGQVVASNTADLSEGDWVSTQLGWREHCVVDAKGALKVDPDVAPVSTALGVLGMPGFTAWVGLTEFGRPKEGETLFVSGAAGAVGSMVGQLGRLRDLRVVGSAGSDEKVAPPDRRAGLRRRAELQDRRSERRPARAAARTASTSTSTTWAATTWRRR